MKNVIEFNGAKPRRFVFEKNNVENPHDNKEFLFSVVIAIYNAAEYLNETIDSVINQTIGFKENIQLVLVNDGSKDDSAKVCASYAKKYPNNILLINKVNGGVSSARNVGMLYARGKFINFLDSDDKWGENVFEKVKNFYDKSEAYTDVVAVRNELFGDKTGDSWFNEIYRNGDRVVNLWKEPTIYLNSVNNCFFHTRISNQLHFDENLSISEDLKVVNTVLFNKYSLGVLNSCRYYYRIKSNETSLAFSARKKENWYFTYLNRVALWLFKYAKTRCGFVPAFLQYTLFRDLYNRFNNNVDFVSVIPAEKWDEYKKLLFSCFEYIDDSTIKKNTFLNSNWHVYFLYIKHGVPLITVNEDQTITYTFEGGTTVIQKLFVSYNHYKVVGGKAVVEGYIPLPVFDRNYKCKISANCSQNKCTVIVLPDAKNDTLAFGNEYSLKRHYFKAEVDVKEFGTNKFELFVNIGKVKCPIVLFSYAKWFPLTGLLNDPLFYEDGVLLSTTEGYLSIGLDNLKDYEKREKENIKDLKKRNNKNSLEAAKYYELELKKLKHGSNKKKVWIISDRHVAAGDNGEALYRYVLRNKPAGVDAYYAIDKSSIDYNRLEKEGFRVIDLTSPKYRDIYASSDVIISSYMEQSEANPFYENELMRPIVARKRIVFLQHGITKDDVSTYYSRKTMKIDLFITTTKPEYESIITNNGYLCDAGITKLTGFPRYDLLDNAPEKIVLLMPTWRNRSVTFGVNGLGAVVNPEFNKSEYYNFYHALLSDERLYKLLEKYGYKLFYFPHNNMVPTNDFFKDIKGLNIVEGADRDYHDFFKKAALMITDYSSTAFDFAYMDKPVIYCQGDEKSFFSSHTYVKGYFSYEKNGFGPIIRTIDELLSELEKLLERSCCIKDKYEDRIKQTYCFRDHDNSKRVVEEIIKLG